MKKMLKTAAALLLSGCMLTSPVLAATTSFSDVPNDQGINSFVLKAAKDGLVAGVGNGKFGMGQKVTNAEFATMVCKLFYSTEAEAYHNTYKDTYKASEWWRPFLAVAYTKGLLGNTVMGTSRATNNSWSQSIVEQSISRYDMAQVLLNVSKVQGWEKASDQSLTDAKAKIGDWKNIPGKYQDAVAYAYAKGFLSGMQDGTFSGGNNMLREQSAVVLCRMSDAKADSSQTEESPSFTNSTKLVNGKAATEKNVISALDALKKEYPTGYIWNVNKNYSSPELGNAKSGNGFIYMISDQVFGNMEAEETEPEDLKAGDLIYLRGEGNYVLVEEVDGDKFTYAACNSSGRVTWGKKATIDDIGSKDEVYTRYDGDEKSDLLSNGKEATQANVEKLIKQFLDEEYSDGDEWDYGYKSDVLGSGRVYESEAFAYYFSDYIFEELEAEDVKDFDDLRVGDIIYLDDSEEYVVVTGIDGDTIDYAGVYQEKIYTDNLDVDDLTSKDKAYTRYPEAKDEEEEGTLSNGKAVTQANVEKLVEKFDDEEYTEDDEWDSSHKSAAFGSKRVYDSQAFAYYFSDYIFGDLKAKEVENFDDLKVGDVIYWDDFEEYIVVTAVDGDTVDYTGVYNKKIYVDELDVDDLDSKDSAWTRYPEAKEEEEVTLSNGKAATQANVEKLIEKFVDEEYSDDDEWDYSYKSAVFGSKRVYDSQAFAYYFSDYIFGELDVEAVEDFDDLRVGDVIYWDDFEEYIVVTEVGSGSVEYMGVYNKKVYTDELDVSELDSKDSAQTRYPEKVEEEDSDRLSNGKKATSSNVKKLLDQFQKEKYGEGDKWDTTYKSRKFSSKEAQADEAFAYFLSDYVFGDLKVKKVTKFADLRVGDVVYQSNAVEYVVVTAVNKDTISYVGVYDEEVYKDEFDVDILGKDAFAYTRYP